ncbi:MAG: PIG-L deacetylase family protein [Terriglobales bacterium]
MKLTFTLPRKASSSLRILCLGAHSDDIEIGCGASVIKLLKQYPKARVVWVVFSGEKQRAKEAQASARLFLKGASASDIQTHDFRASYFPSQMSDIKGVFETLKVTDPDLIFTHTIHDYHQDHRVICELTWNTFRSHCILEYEIPKYDGDTGSPNVFIELERSLVVQKSKNLLRCFRSQRQRSWFTAETFEGLARLRGIQCASHGGYAEAFFGRKISIL